MCWFYCQNVWRNINLWFGIIEGRLLAFSFDVFDSVFQYFIVCSKFPVCVDDTCLWLNWNLGYILNSNDRIRCEWVAIIVVAADTDVTAWCTTWDLHWRTKLRVIHDFHTSSLNCCCRCASSSYFLLSIWWGWCSHSSTATILIYKNKLKGNSLCMSVSESE